MSIFKVLVVIIPSNSSQGHETRGRGWYTASLAPPPTKGGEAPETVSGCNIIEMEQRHCTTPQRGFASHHGWWPGWYLGFKLTQQTQPSSPNQSKKNGFQVIARYYNPTCFQTSNIFKHHSCITQVSGLHSSMPSGRQRRRPSAASTRPQSFFSGTRRRLGCQFLESI